jgi:fluoride ion exporter CrcB/FEX
MVMATVEEPVSAEPTGPITAPVGSEIPAHKSDGPLAAVLLAAGIGSFVLGLLTTWAAASTEFREDLQLNDRVGPLSGKTIYATAAFIIAWVVLGYLWRSEDARLRTATIAFVVLVALGLLGTFPTFFQAFE